MKCIARYLYCFLIILFSRILFGQDVPNAGFEVWNGNSPADWMPNDAMLVTQSIDAHSGSYSVQFEIVRDQEILYNGRLFVGSDGLGFDYFQRPDELTGYYKLNPQVGDHLLVDVFLWKDGGTTLVAHKLETFPNPANTWTEFKVPISYILPDDPDRCTIEISIGYFQEPGGILLVDDLHFQFTSGVEEISDNIPDQFELMQNYPNPFNPITNIQFALPQRSFVSIAVFNSLGEKIETLVSEELDSGTYNYAWIANGLPSGVYFYTLKAMKFMDTKKLVLLK